MKIGIVGMGVAGAYLASRLSDSHEVVGYERMAEDKFDAPCAWATSRYGIARFTKACGISFDDYVLYEGRDMHVDLGTKVITIRLKGLCTFDKLRLIKDFAKDQQIRFNHYVNAASPMGDYDLIIDAAGIGRPLLPRINGDTLIPCLQYKVRYKEPPFDDFYIKPFLPELSGYFWYFPLGGGYAHIGAGDVRKRHGEELTRFLKRYPSEVVKKTGRPVRITPPSLCEPIYSGKIVGVGESIGTVYPILGEGIIPSLQCADLLIEHLNDLFTYRAKVLEKFKAYNWAFHLVKSRINNGFNLFNQLWDILHVFTYMKRNEDRIGVQVNLSDIFKVVRS